MPRFFCILTLVIVCAACSTLNAPETPPYDFKVDVDRYLSARDAKHKNEALARLKQHAPDHKVIKTYLREKARGSGGLPGLHRDQQFTHDGQTYSYAVFAPESLDPEKDYPLIVVLHGMGGNGNTTVMRWLERLGNEFIIVCPSYPMGAWWTLRAEKLVLNLIRHTRQSYPVDPNRIFLAGLSNGALGAYMIGMFYPDRFAGIVPIAGAISDRYLHFLVNMKNTPLYSIQGRFDPIFPIQFSRRIQKILTDLRYPLVYREHKEKGLAHGGHFLPESEVQDLVQWLKTQKREPHPTTLRMIREANHLDNIQWARVTRGLKMVALQLPGPEPEAMNIQDGKIATMLVVHKEPNLFEVQGQNLIEHELYLDADRVDLDQPVIVTFEELKEKDNQFVTGPKRVTHHEKAEKDLEVLLSGFARRWDPELLYDAKITVVIEDKVQFAYKP